ncbi:MAG: glycogen/starch/alpha-glucan phosphorylase, partial [Alphaproteobacteria bacterium]|nr:glycogen/starch/alpha-glucan phosphorylase [Alphaproteobacteria bacterium]
LNLDLFNKGGYVAAVEENIKVETISKVLYPSDNIAQGKFLRLIQQYFFVSCVLNDVLRRFSEEHLPFDELPNKVVLQLNDTHPTLAIAELMRLLVDVYGLEWDRAWKITRGCMAYTNHTLLPEALEKWPVSLFEKVIPRHLLIIYEINEWLLHQVRQKYPNDNAKVARMSLIEEGAEKQIRMANLAITGSFSVNGVAEIHTELVKHKLVPDFYDLWPKKFNNKTNGVTPRRWLLQADSDLADFITKHIGTKWITKLDELKKLEPLVKDEGALKEINAIQHKNKEKLAHYVEQTMGIKLNPDAIFDCQVKRIHEYKRQLLNAFHIMHQYLSFIEDGIEPIYPKVYIFGGKAAPSYDFAKLTIKFINNIAQIINNDKRLKNQLKVVFIPDYKVSNAELIIPAADVSEQISTAGFEASGTSNMKFALNGALTIGTMDGANVEIHDAVGADNIFIFGMNVEEVKALRASGYNPADFIARSETLQRIMKLIESNFFSPGETDIFRPLLDSMHSDTYMNAADFESYCSVQQSVSEVYRQPKEWNRRCVMNIANMGGFSSDRSIQEYAHNIWHLEPCPVELKEFSAPRK